jgi:type II secretory pathway pseudopilin PulG
MRYIHQDQLKNLTPRLIQQDKNYGKFSKKQRRFTMVELLIVIAIVIMCGVLVSLSSAGARPAKLIKEVVSTIKLAQTTFAGWSQTAGPAVAVPVQDMQLRDFYICPKRDACRIKTKTRTIDNGCRQVRAHLYGRSSD